MYACRFTAFKCFVTMLAKSQSSSNFAYPRPRRRHTLRLKNGDDDVPLLEIPTYLLLVLVSEVLISISYLFTCHIRLSRVTKGDDQNDMDMQG
eukprot:6208509-Pleurochrysis_carterae.AAC.2